MRMLPLLYIISLCLALTAGQARGAVPFGGAPYCSIPPGTGAGIKANVLLMLDNSASVADLAYTDPSLYCVDESYDRDASYPGYFDEKSIYRYDTDRFVFDSAPPLQVSDCTGACVVSNPYLYLEMSGSSPNRKVQTFKASGKFLNWLSMSKLDLEKKVLTGGKYDTANGVLVGESRGCQGKRFIKLVKEPNQGMSTPPQVTFAVRGEAPNPPKTGYIYEFLPTSPGGTRIEIYDRSYRKSECLAAVADWKSGNGANFRSDVIKCMGEPGLMTDPDYPATPSRERVYLEIRSNCYLSPAAPSGTNDEAAGSCASRTNRIYGGGTRLYLIKRWDGDNLCGKDFSHPNYSDTNDTGFLGNKVPRAGTTYPYWFSDSEERDYCRSLFPAVVPDLSATAAFAGTGGNLPGYVLDLSLFSLGTPAGSMQVRVSVAAPPTGLIQHYSGDLNFGAMVFSSNGGAGAECGDGKLLCGTCRSNPGAACSKNSDCVKPAGYGPCRSRVCAWDASKACSVDIDCVADTDFGPCEYGGDGSDGGKVVSYLNDDAYPLGDHSAGLISIIDSTRAGTWSPLAEAFYDAIGYFAHRSQPMRLQPGDFDDSKPPSRFLCQRNNVLIVSDGISSADRRAEVNDLVAKYKGELPAPVNITGGGESSPPSLGSYNLDDLAWLARHRNISDFDAAPAHGRDYISTYVVYTGASCGSYNSDGSCKTADEGVPEKLMQLTAAKGGGKFAGVNKPLDLENALRHTLQEIAAGSGTDATILSSGDGNAALFFHELYYPSKSFDGGATFSYWMGEMQSLWYYIDPFLGGTDGSKSSIREDSDGNHQLNLDSDRVVSYDAGTNLTYATGPGGKSPVAMDQLTSLWRAGKELWRRDLANDGRTIKTTLDGSTLIDFSGAKGEALAPYLNVSASEAPAIIDFVHGKDAAGYRSRTVAITGSDGTTSRGVWKLGDIISSTPQAQSPAALGNYHLPPPRGYNDFSYLKFIRSTAYQTRGMVYVGANDGMLHAFRVGTLDDTGSAGNSGTLTGTGLGKEAWGFIPRNALPYLKYLAEPSYQHLYYVDAKPSLIDASIRESSGSGGCDRETYDACLKSERSWMTVLIGGMGLGGASALECAPGSNCVQVPRRDPLHDDLGLGYSSYFALDVTDPENPTLLWEFSNPSLGFSTTGPAIVRVGPRDKNGRWFAVFGSGPTGPMLANRQFGADSNQNLQFFVVDLRTGTLVKTIDTGISHAFSGSLAGGAIDADKWNPAAKGHYQDDAVYAGYSKKADGGAWTGGVVRIVTRENSNPADTAKPWGWSTVTERVGPVTGGIARLQDRANHKLWLYFGSGRYFFGQDDPADRRALYGVKEPCYAYQSGPGAVPDALEGSCTGSAGVGSPGDALTSTDDGWRIDLDRAEGSFGAERVTSTPTSMTGGAVFFPTYAPSVDPCLSGNSYLWGVRYDTGGELPQKILGKVLVPLSGGATREAAMEKGGRRAAAVPGRPGAAKVVSNSGLRPVKKIIQIQER